MHKGTYENDKNITITTYKLLIKYKNEQKIDENTWIIIQNLKIPPLCPKGIPFLEKQAHDRIQSSKEKKRNEKEP